jgi:hypothetical protein
LVLGFLLLKIFAENRIWKGLCEETHFFLKNGSWLKKFFFFGSGSRSGGAGAAGERVPHPGADVLATERGVGQEDETEKKNP